MIKWFKKKFIAWVNQEPYIDVIRSSVDGTPLTQLVTPRMFDTSGWRIETTDKGKSASVLKFAIDMDLGKHLEQLIKALSGDFNDRFTREDIDHLAYIAQKAVDTKGYRAFKHNGKTHMEFVNYSLDPRDITKLRQAIIHYNFVKLSTKQKS